uniref:Carbonic anhydrase 4 n=1 Tax=Pseudonaja textilis TaxID=8673 RepID=A0A670YV66_PSETE
KKRPPRSLSILLLGFPNAFFKGVLDYSSGSPKDFNYSECGNDKQSPINILTRQVTYNESLKAFNFINYNVKSNGKWTMENNGHTVIVQLDPSGKVELGGLNGRYKVVQFHFHWGSEVGKTQSPGSEHSIDGERYPMEVKALRNIPSPNSGIRKHVFKIYKVKVKVKVKVKFHFIFFYQTSKLRTNSLGPVSSTLALESLIPDKKDLTNFYRYTGSLTTPGCNEEVVWTLFEKPIELGGEQGSVHPTDTVVSGFQLWVHFCVSSFLPLCFGQCCGF